MRTSFSLSCLKSLFPDVSLWFFPHIVFSAGVSLLHAYLTFLLTPRSFPHFDLYYEPVSHFHAKKHHGHDFSLWVLPTHCLLCRCFPSSCLSYIPVDFKVFSILWSFLRTSFSLPCQNHPWSWLQPLVSSHTLSSLQVFRFSMLIIHSCGLQGLFGALFFFYENQFFTSMPKTPWSWLQPLVSSHTLPSQQVFPFSMPI